MQFPGCKTPRAPMAGGLPIGRSMAMAEVCFTLTVVLGYFPFQSHQESRVYRPKRRQLASGAKAIPCGISILKSSAVLAH